MDNLSYFKGKRVLITGHSGFKGSWMTAALNILGAKCFGVSRGISKTSSISASAIYKDQIAEYNVDISDYSKLLDIVNVIKPDIIIHMAAQPLVLESYRDPYRTHRDNILGTLNILEIARTSSCVHKMLIVTTDKVYENQESIWPYRETDKLGGHDPYASSKAAADILAQSYAESFFSNDANEKVVMVARGGNVIGGGDLSDSRLVPDIIKSLNSNQPLVIRNKHSVRPWQHVIDLTIGYLHFISQSEKNIPTCLNFGPNSDSNISVEQLVLRLSEKTNQKVNIRFVDATLHETQLLKLDNTLAKESIGWEPRIEIDHALGLIADWIMSTGSDAFVLAQSQLKPYLIPDK